MTYLNLSQAGNVEELDRLQGFIKRFGRDGLKTFLSLEYGGTESGLLDFAESEVISDEQKANIFKNFSYIYSEAFHLRSIFDNEYLGSALGLSSQVHKFLT